MTAKREIEKLRIEQRMELTKVAIGVLIAIIIVLAGLSYDIGNIRHSQKATDTWIAEHLAGATWERTECKNESSFEWKYLDPNAPLFSGDACQLLIVNWTFQNGVPYPAEVKCFRNETKQVCTKEVLTRRPNNR